MIIKLLALIAFLCWLIVSGILLITIWGWLLLAVWDDDNYYWFKIAESLIKKIVE